MKQISIVGSLIALVAISWVSIGCDSDSGSIVRGPLLSAPAVSGVDLEGEHFSLSDYQGKIVMLSFWADW
ncbi:MAG: hypothetical protein R3C03_03135 [Pirellulaceae bacterium]